METKMIKIDLNIIVLLSAGLFIFAVIGIFMLDHLEREESCNKQKIELTRFHEFNDTTKSFVKLAWGLDKCYEFYPQVDITRYK